MGRKSMGRERGKGATQMNDFMGEFILRYRVPVSSQKVTCITTGAGKHYLSETTI